MRLLYGIFPFVNLQRYDRRHTKFPERGYLAIATALMPPLCTAGYGLASGNLIYFLGAFYLYFINSVFISLATFLGVRVMHFQRKEFVDKTREKTVRKYIVLIVVLTSFPPLDE